MSITSKRSYINKKWEAHWKSQNATVYHPSLGQGGWRERTRIVLKISGGKRDIYGLCCGTLKTKTYGRDNEKEIKNLQWKYKQHADTNAKPL